MKHINLTNYALLTENKSSGYYSVTEADIVAPKIAAKPLSIDAGDSEEIKAIKGVIINKTPVEAFNALTAAATALAASTSVKSVVDVTIDTKTYKVDLNKIPDTKPSQIWIDYDSASLKLIEGLNLEYITNYIREQTEGIGTAEEEVAAMAGAIYAYCREKGGNPKAVMAAVAKYYTENKGEEFYAMLDADFDGSPKVLVDALFGKTVSQDQINTALMVDAGQSLLVDLTIMLGLWAVTAPSAGVAAPAAAVQTAKVGSTLKNIFTFGKSARTAKALETGIVAAETALTGAKLLTGANKLRQLGSAISLSAEEVKLIQGVKNASQINRFLTATKGGSMSLNGQKMAAELAADSPGFFKSIKELFKISPTVVNQLVAAVGGPKKAALLAGSPGAIDTILDTTSWLTGNPEDENETGSNSDISEDGINKLVNALYNEAKSGTFGYTDSGAELKIAFLMLSLTPETYALVDKAWTISYGAKYGNLYNSCVVDELDFDLFDLVNGYLGSFGIGELTGKVAELKANLAKPASTEPAKPVKESITNPRLKTFNDFYKK